MAASSVRGVNFALPSSNCKLMTKNGISSASFKRSKNPRRRWMVVRAEGEQIQNKGMTRDGPAQGGRWLSCTTRHVRLYAAAIDPVTFAMDQTQIDKLTLILDPDSEFLWPDDKVEKVYDHLRELVDTYEGAPLDEYTLRLVGSDIEHFIRKLLLAGEIQYNLDCRVLNFSMGKPRLNLYSPEQDQQQQDS
ncbi:NAD(P)H-quinone oxidoreductase subunit M, chloroplastic [Selaginella moellendorffii]|uniref:NAD(P)H-quinone oxidoreductase subunit M, chloroplastic n=1 Tax=Selaginella moellendorffii TaxID=88036 RepID=UPI000D1C619B|nr:NAD(P)H-quinone oxidoreductase subunit M, chloroplastic [Selaginella moellendorffii]|eukprot:XP_002989170.2 NAD(P)H-quinone oxidoreductase subunit M, chloroplastic [Selaginella moellendorffii]